MVILSGRRIAVSLDTSCSGKGERKEPSSSFLHLSCREEVWASNGRGMLVFAVKAPAPGQNLELAEPPPIPNCTFFLPK